MSNKQSKISRKRSNLDFHLDKIKELENTWRYIKSIPNFPISNRNHFYSRNDESGWWMVIKQIAIRSYINAYLKILGKREGLKLIFIDLMSSFGLISLTKEEGRSRFIFPGTSINAALISKKKSRGFDEFYINDLNFIERDIILERFKAINKSCGDLLNINMCLENKRIDSNDWIIEILKDINKKNNYYHYLMVIDNEGMNISFDTLKKIREIHDFGDIIITFQDAAIGRNLQHEDTIKSFFGTNIPKNTKRADLCDIYIQQLSSIGLQNVEKMKVASATGFYYTLLFCVRGGSQAGWLKLIKYYNDQRFRNFTGKDIKLMWDIAKGKQARLF